MREDRCACCDVLTLPIHNGLRCPPITACQAQHEWEGGTLCCRLTAWQGTVFSSDRHCLGECKGKGPAAGRHGRGAMRIWSAALLSMAVRQWPWLCCTSLFHPARCACRWWHRSQTMAGAVCSWSGTLLSMAVRQCPWLCCTSSFHPARCACRWWHQSQTPPAQGCCSQRPEHLPRIVWLVMWTCSSSTQSLCWAPTHMLWGIRRAACRPAARTCGQVS